MLHRKLLKKYLPIVLYLSLGVLTDLILTPLFEILFKSSFIGIRIFTLIEFFLLNTFLFQITINNRKKVFYSFSILLFLCAFIFENFIQFQNNFDSIVIAISALTILIHAVLYLYNKVKTEQILDIKDADFLITVSLVLYFSGTFFIYLLSKNNYFENYFQNYFVIINSVFIIIRNSLIIYAFMNTLRDNQLHSKKINYTT